MLTYRLGTSTLGLADAALVWGIAGKWLKQRIKKAKQAKGHFLGLFVGNILAEFLAVNGFELLNRLVTQLLWRFHAIHNARAALFKIDWGICRFRQTRPIFRADTCYLLIDMS
jgi:hypothetical protein